MPTPTDRDGLAAEDREWLPTYEGLLSDDFGPEEDGKWWRALVPILYYIGIPAFVGLVFWLQGGPG
ncbi:MAG: hypothetical protein KGL39_15270 [Patescibacteria group bacterium]|nr:hypothetical protein [Patescibacteria group bacterium]